MTTQASRNIIDAVILSNGRNVTEPKNLRLHSSKEKIIAKSQNPLTC